ncbi:MAG: hypothetical protein K1060chlam1_01424 [Candidatus Anoxychlamydiales bacterium]|nr:hypothetical protein [Candidatus Anoxychlamydiales bacterium]
MAVSLSPRGPKEWVQAYSLWPKTDPQKILNLCDEMEVELGQVNAAEDQGGLGSLIAKFANYSYGDEDETFHIRDGKHQEFANAYRELETRLSKLEKLEEELNLYLGKSEISNPTVVNKRNLLATKMANARKTRDALLNLYTKLNFVPYNKVFQSATNIFISVPLKKMSSYFKIQKIETLALGAFALIAGYSIMTNTNPSFLMTLVRPGFFMLIGGIFHKIYYKKSNELPAQQQTISFTMTPPGSPVR